MKVIYALGIAQFAAILLLVSKINSLENDLHSLAASSQLKVQQAPQSADDVVEQLASIESSAATPTLEKSVLSLQTIRMVVRQELTTALAKASPNITSVQSSVDLLKDLPANPQQVEKVRSQLDYFMSDGQFTLEELNQVESSLATMNYDDRQSVLKKMALAMNRANVKLSQ